MYQILLVSFLVVAVALIGLILIQHGKGADMGASFGAGASNTVFGASGSGNFLTRSTAILAVLFFSLALGLGYLTAHQTSAVTTDVATQIEQQEAAKAASQKEITKPATEVGIPDVEVNETPAAGASAIPDVKVPAEKKAQKPAIKTKKLKSKAGKKPQDKPKKAGSGH